MPNATFDSPDLTTFARLDELGLVAVGQRLSAERAVLECRLAEEDPWCRACGARSTSRGTITRRLAHQSFGHRPTTLLVRIRRYRCDHCGNRWREDTTAAAPERAKLSRGGMRWALEALVIDHLTIARIAAGLGVAWHTANDAVLAEGQQLLIDDPARFDAARVIGVDEHLWRHTRRGDKYVTVIIDLTPARDKTGPARLLDMIPGRSKAAFKAWLKAHPKAWKDRIEVVAMDGFTGYKTAAGEALPGAVAVMDPFHVVRLAGDALERLPTTRPAAAPQAQGPQGRPPLQDSPHPPHRHQAADRPPMPAPQQPVRAREARCGRGDLGDLPGDGRRLPRTRPGESQSEDGEAHHRAEQARPGRLARAGQARPNTDETGSSQMRV